MSETNGHANNGQTQGGGGALFARPDNIRSDARLAARLISLGVVPEEQAVILLKQGFVLGAQAAAQGNVRNWAACMKILLGVGRLEQIERLKQDPDLGGALAGVSIENAQIVFNVPDNGRGPKRIDMDGFDDSDG